MELKTKVKFNKVNNLSDARYAAGMWATWVGFDLSENNPESITLETCLSISGWIEGVNLVAEFENSSLEYILDVLDKTQFSWVEIVEESFIEPLKSKGYEVIFKGNSESVANLIHTNNVQSLNVLNPSKCLLNFSGELLELESILEQYPTLGGISVNGAGEERPGFKNQDDVSDIMEYLEIE